MKFSIRLGLAVTFLATLVAAPITMTTPASAITAELANKCREMSLKAFPPQRAGKKGGNAGEARKYYATCITNNGAMPEIQPQKPAAAPAR